MSRLIEKLGVRKLAIVPFFLVLNTISTYSFSLLAKRPNWLYVRKVRDTSRRKENRMTADRKSTHRMTGSEALFFPTNCLLISYLTGIFFHIEIRSKC